MIFKIIMDNIFGIENFIGENIWRRKYQSATIASNTRSFGNNHDIIFFYTKNKDYTFNRLTKTVGVDESKYMHDGGGYFKTSPAGNYCKKTLDKMLKNGNAYITRNKRIRKKTYLEEINGKVCDKRVIDNIWLDLPNMMHTPRKERTGYPTQKPLALLDRIIKASSDSK